MQPTMSIPYENPSFLFPPRPENAVPPSMISSYEGRGWVGQYKMNGTCSLIIVDPKGEISTFTRHKDQIHKMWKPTERTKAIANFCPKGQWTVFLAELLNDKTPAIKDTLYIFDILVWESKQLLGTTFQERQDFLHELLLPVVLQKGKKKATPWWEKAPDKSHIVISPGIWLAKTIRTGLGDTFARIKQTGDRAVEGLVLKDPNGKLEFMFKAGNNQGWQVKSRVALPNSQMGW